MNLIYYGWISDPQILTCKISLLKSFRSNDHCPNCFHNEVAIVPAGFSIRDIGKAGFSITNTRICMRDPYFLADL